ncbi:DNA mismatch repair protein MutT [Candidatus Roizmanbacteria bacterium CG_4_10_14_0_8_um_filter_39_9]|uniref:DNA mismatch repair protein MutT n=1 Tax=Candidatus Roizmanbacteria bacterium CG_4_10_14_0_8_um_filter_39_9 TaxID=1974829 RepID=A0A2M7QCH3_9BACT|nr:MAG: DNA mismatch repair protein MutT [Candidatus Roizmanbacteria bacterium CG_4_10_14_0_8_um_filter_39_9]
MTDQHIGVCVIVLDESKHKVLLGKRKNAYLAGAFGLPGGRVNLTEPLVECAVRELREETGLTAKLLRYVGVVRELQNCYNFIHFVYVCNKYSGTMETKEPEKCEGWEWYPLNSLPSDILPGHKSSLELLLNKDLLIQDLV